MTLNDDDRVWLNTVHRNGAMTTLTHESIITDDKKDSDGMNSTAELPCIIDVEASGFGRGSFPIEIGIALPDGDIVSRLIHPMSAWQHWDKEAEALHGISYEQLQREGDSPENVAIWLNHLLRDVGTIYSDSWGFDSSWVARLFNDVGIIQRFRIESLRILLSENQMRRWDGVRETIQKTDKIRRHRAGEDVKLLQKTFGLTRD